MIRRRPQAGFTLIELMVAMLLAGLLLAGMTGMIRQAMGTDTVVDERNRLLQDARFALGRMTSFTSRSRGLLLPLADNPNTNWPEHIREETVPASPPIGASTLATAVLAVTLPADVDLDADGFPDADDDRDGRIDEDLPDDAHHDFQPGIMLIDDDGDGSVDETGVWADDDEQGGSNEDPIDGIDNDGDGNIDEDQPTDMNGDGCAGICGVDDDASGAVDNAASDNDDEAGSGFEDGYDPVVFYLDGNRLMERMPVPWNEDGISTPDGPVDGRDFISSVIAENVTRFRVERLSSSDVEYQLVDIVLELEGRSGIAVDVNARVRIGGAL